MTDSNEQLSNSVLQDDLRKILGILGLSTNARPYSPHEVFENEVIPEVLKLVQRVDRLVAITKQVSDMLEKYELTVQNVEDQLLVYNERVQGGETSLQPVVTDLFNALYDKRIWPDEDE